MFQFDADKVASEEGIWVPYGGSEFLIAHISNMKFQKALARLQLPHRRALDRGTLEPETQRDITCKALAEGVLRDWRKVVNSKKEPVLYTKEAGVVALTKDAAFRDFVSDTAMNLGNFSDEEKEEMGND